MNLPDDELDQLRQRLHQLQIEHRDLDLVIDHLGPNPPPDELLLRRLKQRRLRLKDQITAIEALLVPDIPA